MDIMGLEVFLTRFKEQYADFEQFDLDVDMDFRLVESYDSLTGMSILVMIKDEYDYNLNEIEYLKLRTVREVYEYIQNHMK